MYVRKTIIVAYSQKPQNWTLQIFLLQYTYTTNEYAMLIVYSSKSVHIMIISAHTKLMIIVAAWHDHELIILDE